jgi:hypothetical protein
VPAASTTGPVQSWNAMGTLNVVASALTFWASVWPYWSYLSCQA